MSKRKGRKRRTGRKVYYPRRSEKSVQDTPPRHVIMAEIAGKQRFTSEANLKARAIRENRSTDAVLNTFGLKRNADNEPREAALDHLSHLIKLEDMDRHMVVHKGLLRVCIMFHDADRTKFWFVERNLATGHMKRSVDYGDLNQAYTLQQIGRVTWRVSA